jgi:hypothetical protein
MSIEIVFCLFIGRRVTPPEAALTAIEPTYSAIREGDWHLD